MANLTRQLTNEVEATLKSSVGAMRKPARRPYQINVATAKPESQKLLERNQNKVIVTRRIEAG